MAVKGCLHKHSTLVQTWIDADKELGIDAATVAIHQCDMCGITIPDKEVGDIDDPMTLPIIDVDAVHRAFDQIWKEIMSDINQKRTMKPMLLKVHSQE